MNDVRIEPMMTYEVEKREDGTLLVKFPDKFTGGVSSRKLEAGKFPLYGIEVIDAIRSLIAQVNQLTLEVEELNDECLAAFRLYGANVNTPEYAQRTRQYKPYVRARQLIEHVQTLEAKEEAKNVPANPPVP